MPAVFIALVLAAALAALAAEPTAGHWPQWRGPSHDGSSPLVGLPTRWSKTDNVQWSLPLPDRSGSTPIVWGDRVFISVAEAGNISLWAADRAKGTVLWKNVLGAGDVRMRKHNMSSPSPVTDGKLVVAVSGTGIVRALTFDGQELWTRDLQKEHGTFGLNWGYASSPLLEGAALYIQVLHGMKTDEPSYVMRLDPATGKTVWRVERATDAIRESPDSYTTPAMVRRGGKAELVVSGGDCVTGHDPATGKELWRASGLNPDKDPYYRIVASPVILGDLVFVPSRVKPLLAIRAFGSGDVSTSHRVWSFDRGPDVPTPTTDGKHLYLVTDKGILHVLDAKTGAVVYGDQRLRPGTYSASPILAEGRLYVTSEDGVTSVVKAGPTFELIAENDVAEYTLSSLAVAPGQLLLRTESNLYALGNRK